MSAAPRRGRLPKHRTQQRGFVLLGVVLTLLLAAAIAYQLSRESAQNVNAAASEAQALQARYVAESGLAYAAARLNTSGACIGIAAGAPVTGQIGTDSFSVTSTTVGTNPLTLQLTSTPTLAATGTAFAPLAKQVVLHTRVEQQTTVYRAATGVVADTFVPRQRSGLTNAKIYNFGADPVLILENGSNVSTVLLRFNLAGVLPAGARLQAAKLVLTPVTPWGDINDETDLTVHEVTRAWTEGAGTLVAPLLVDSGATWEQPMAGVATWGFVRYLAPQSTVSNSTSGGGDYDPAYVDRRYVEVDSLPATLTWDVTPLAAQSLANPVGNFGLLLKSEQSLKQAKFASSENPVWNKRPRLALTYLAACGGPVVALSISDVKTSQPIAVATVNTPVRLRIDLANSAPASASVSGTFTIALPANTSVASPAGASVVGCGGMTFAPAAGDTTLALVGGSIPAASGTAPGTCYATVSVGMAQASGTATLASGPTGIATTLSAGAGQLVTNQGTNADAASASLHVVALPTLAADTSIWLTNPNTNYGTETSVKLMYKDSRRMLVRFASLLPAGVSLQSATLRLYVRSIANRQTTPITIQPYLVTKAWTENTVVWNKASTWSNEGGDYTSPSLSPVLTHTLATIPSPGLWLGLDVLLLVKEWANGFANNGLLLISTNSADPGEDAVSIDSRELTGGIPAQLQITY